MSNICELCGYMMYSRLHQRNAETPSRDIHGWGPTKGGAPAVRCVGGVSAASCEGGGREFQLRHARELGHEWKEGGRGTAVPPKLRRGAP